MKKRTPNTTIELLDSVKSLKNIDSDYAIAKFFDVKPASVSKWRNGLSFLDDSNCEKVAAALDLPVGYVLACVHAERAKTETLRDAWASLAASFSAPAAA